MHFASYNLLFPFPFEPWKRPFNRMILYSGISPEARPPPSFFSSGKVETPPLYLFLFFSRCFTHPASHSVPFAPPAFFYIFLFRIQRQCGTQCFLMDLLKLHASPTDNPLTWILNRKSRQMPSPKARCRSAAIYCLSFFLILFLIFELPPVLFDLLDHFLVSFFPSRN